MFSEYEDLKQDLDGGNGLRPNTIKFEREMNKQEILNELKKRMTEEQIRFEDFDASFSGLVEIVSSVWYLAFSRAKYIVDEVISNENEL